jgi:hypothetical protein
MNLDDFVSIIIAAIAVIYALSSIYSAKKRPPQYEYEEEEELEPRVVKVVHEEMPPPPAPTSHSTYEFHSSLEELHTTIDVPKPKKSNIQKLIKSLPEEKLLFLSYEVFHVPVAKRQSPFPWNG